MDDGYIVAELEEVRADIGEEQLSALLDAFRCPVNPEVEEFLKRKAMQSSRLGASVTYLVGGAGHALLGYFTLLLKSFRIGADGLSSANRRLVSRFAELDGETGCYNAAVYLIAQLGKNFAVAERARIDGSILLKLAFKILRRAQSLVGGKLVLVEREMDRPKLLDFYRANNFRSWNVRHSERDGVTYDQMLCNLRRSDK